MNVKGKEKTLTLIESEPCHWVMAFISVPVMIFTLPDLFRAFCRPSTSCFVPPLRVKVEDSLVRDNIPCPCAFHW